MSCIALFHSCRGYYCENICNTTPHPLSRREAPRTWKLPAPATHQPLLLDSGPFNTCMRLSTFPMPPPAALSLCQCSFQNLGGLPVAGPSISSVTPTLPSMSSPPNTRIFWCLVSCWVAFSARVIYQGASTHWQSLLLALSTPATWTCWRPPIRTP